MLLDLGGLALLCGCCACWVNSVVRFNEAVAQRPCTSPDGGSPWEAVLALVLLLALAVVLALVLALVL